ncbi:MAG TPA: CFI-box-CTERM domain-containing protein [Dongiaceae bacterium]|nr:CFI-box-CTERM domain-containing protein [Dongiaceae bacterium]
MTTARESINAVIGDLSAVRAGIIRRNLHEQTRIQHHLQFVHDQLGANTPQDLTLSQRRNRRQVLSVLQNYLDQGVFPQHDDSALHHRQPRFIDHRGVHCAVGFLARETGDERWGEWINANFEYAYVPEIDSPELLDWAQANGLTVRDCALIQPTYLPPLTECPMVFLAKDTPLEAKLDIVRTFRDTQLLQAPGGHWAVKYYYQSGPTVVHFLHAHRWSQLPARKFLAALIDVLEERVAQPSVKYK